MRFRIPPIPMALFAAVLFFALCIPGAAYAAKTSPAPLSLSLVRAVRLSDTSITLSFKTSQNAVGILRYTTADGGDITLTDSAPEADHLFTLDSLDANHGYTFIMKAEIASGSSNTYNVLLSPDTIGPAGSSEMPGVQEIDAQGTVVSSTVTASTTLPNAGGIPLWAYVVFILVVAVGYGFYQYTQRVQPKTDVQ